MAGTSPLRVRENQLDRDWLDQPELMQEYCERAADARKRVNEAKDALAVVEAEQKREARLHPSRYGIVKLSNDAVNEAVVLTQPYREASRELIEAQHELELIQASVTALEHKKKALENLVSLWSMSYFSQPRSEPVDEERLRESRRNRVLQPKRKRSE